jgi:hypothetical protein
MSMKIGFLAAAALVTTTGAFAADPASDNSVAERVATATPAEQGATAAEAGAEPQEEKKICRTERATGSLTRRTRVCLTAAQWREVNAKTYRGVTEMQGSASGSQEVNRSAESTGF